MLLCVVAAAYCAPVSETVQEQKAVDGLDRVKRAKEEMMPHNEGDEVSEKRKRSSQDIPAAENIDKEGRVMAKPVVDISGTTEDTEPSEDASTEGSEEVPIDLAESEIGGEIPVDDDDDDDVETGDVAEEPAIGETETEDDEQSVAGTDEATYLKALKELNMFQPSIQTPSYPNVLLDQQYRFNPYDLRTAAFQGYRFKRSQTREREDILSPRLRLLKRNRRYKRDLMYPSELLSDGYYPIDDSYGNLPYGTYEEGSNDDDLNYLLDLIDEARGNEPSAVDDQVMYEPYNSYSPYEELDKYYPELDNVPTYVVPKRQSGLTFVPGLKRRDFYPAFEEPETHFSAFVPQKRSAQEYADAYQRVMGLAAALRREGGYPDEGFEDYYKRK